MFLNSQERGPGFILYFYLPFLLSNSHVDYTSAFYTVLTHTLAQLFSIMRVGSEEKTQLGHNDDGAIQRCQRGRWKPVCIFIAALCFNFQSSPRRARWDLFCVFFLGKCVVPPTASIK